VTSDQAPDPELTEHEVAVQAALDELTHLVLYDRPQQELAALPERLLPIVIAAHLDDLLTELIASRLADNEDARKIAGTSEFVSYGRKIQMAKSLGLITNDLQEALTLVGKIRNHFAHRANAAFGDPETGGAIKRLIDLVIRTHAYLCKLSEREDGDLISSLLRDEIESKGDPTIGVLIDIFVDLREALFYAKYRIAVLGRVDTVWPDDSLCRPVDEELRVIHKSPLLERSCVALRRERQPCFC
jgi:hypothetical protein